MREWKSLAERLADDIMTDNTQIESHKQCLDCIHRGLEIGGKWIADGDRACCRLYPPPDGKPMSFYYGTETCELYESE